MSKRNKLPCKGYITARKAADIHTRYVFAIEAAILLDDLMSGKIDHGEFLLCATVDEPVNNV